MERRISPTTPRSTMPPTDAPMATPAISPSVRPEESVFASEESILSTGGGGAGGGMTQAAESAAATRAPMSRSWRWTASTAVRGVVAGLKSPPEV
eukprot:scaffold55379_cov63-Phaeocystis_antarctica.AAC.1